MYYHRIVIKFITHQYYIIGSIFVLMKYAFQIIFALAILTNFASCTKDKVSKVPLPDGYFEETWDEPLAAAKDYDRNIYVHFYAEWCSLCAEFKSDVLNETEVEAYVEANFVPVTLDSENGVGKEIFEQNNFSGHPISAVFDKDGNLLQFHRGKMTKTEFLDWIKAYE